MKVGDLISFKTKEGIKRRGWIIFMFNDYIEVAGIKPKKHYIISKKDIKERLRGLER